MPAHYRMIHATVTGLPAMLEPAGQDRWRVSLGSPQLPQHIEVLFSGQLPQRSWGQDRWPRRLRRSWTWKSIARFGRSMRRPEAGQGQVLDGQIPRIAQQELLRSKTIAAMQDLANDVAVDQLPEEIVRWYRPWQGRFERSRAIVRRSRSRPVAASPAAKKMMSARWNWNRPRLPGVWAVRPRCRREPPFVTSRLNCSV